MRKKVVVSVYREYLINDVEQRITESRLVGWLVGWLGFHALPFAN